MARLVLVLTVICLASGLMLGVTHSVTREKIQMQEENEKQQALKIVLPEAVSFSVIDYYYKGIDSDGKIIGYAFMTEGQGYSSVLKIMIGIDLKKNIQGIKIVSQKETPGLGDRVNELKTVGTVWDVLKGKKVEQPARPWFQAQFAGKTIDQIDNIDMITGATITSKAVRDAVGKAVNNFKI